VDDARKNAVKSDLMIDLELTVHYLLPKLSVIITFDNYMYTISVVNSMITTFALL